MVLMNAQTSSTYRLEKSFYLYIFACMKNYLNLNILLTIFINIPFIVHGQYNIDSVFYKIEHTSDITKKTDLYIEIFSYFNDKNIDSAALYTSFALESAISSNYTKGEIKALLNKSYIERILGDFDSSRVHIEIALKKAKDINNQLLLGKAYLQVGILYENCVIYNLAYENYMTALRIFKQQKDTLNIINTMNNIAGIHSATNDMEQAFLYYTKALEMSELANDTQSEVMLINNLANIYSAKKQTDKAMKMFKKALIINLENENYRWAAVNNQNISLEYMQLEKLDSAELYINNAYSLVDNFKDNYITASRFAQLGDYYLKRNEIERANNYLHKADSIATKFSIIEILVEIKKTFAELYKQLNDPVKEANYLREYKTFSDTLMSDRNTRLLSELKFKYKYQQEQKEQELVNQRTKYISIIVTIFSILGFVILILLYIQQKTRANKAKIEKEKTHLKNENLQQKLELKNKEITSNTMIQLQKNELLNLIIDKLRNVKYRFAVKNHEIIDETIKELKRSMNENTWNSFLIHFEKVHESFFSSLNHISINLTLNDKRLCAFIRLKMTTKEIATMTNTNIRSIEMARYRLRKKLNILDSTINLDGFLEHL